MFGREPVFRVQYRVYEGQSTITMTRELDQLSPVTSYTCGVLRRQPMLWWPLLKSKFIQKLNEIRASYILLHIRGGSYLNALFFSCFYYVELIVLLSQERHLFSTKTSFCLKASIDKVCDKIAFAPKFVEFCPVRGIEGYIVRCLSRYGGVRGKCQAPLEGCKVYDFRDREHCSILIECDYSLLCSTCLVFCVQHVEKIESHALCHFLTLLQY